MLQAHSHTQKGLWVCVCVLIACVSIAYGRGFVCGTHNLGQSLRPACAQADESAFDERVQVLKAYFLFAYVACP